MTIGGAQMKPLQALLALFAFAFLPLYAADLSDLTYTTTGWKVTITDCNEAAAGEHGPRDYEPSGSRCVFALHG